MTTKSLNKYYDVIPTPHLVYRLAMHQLLSNINQHIKPIFLSILEKNCGPAGHVDIDSEPESVFLKYLRPWAGSLSSIIIPKCQNATTSAKLKVEMIAP